VLLQALACVVLPISLVHAVSLAWPAWLLRCAFLHSLISYMLHEHLFKGSYLQAVIF